MFFILLLFLISLYLLNHAWPLLLRRPVLMLDSVKFLLVMTLLYVVLTALWKNLIGIVWLYGFTLLRQSIGELAFYLIVALSLACIIGMLKTVSNFRRSLNTKSCRPFTTKPLNLNNTFGLAIDWQHDRVFISDTSRHVLYMYDADGSELDTARGFLLS